MSAVDLIKMPETEMLMLMLMLKTLNECVALQESGGSIKSDRSGGGMYEELPRIDVYEERNGRNAGDEQERGRAALWLPIARKVQSDSELVAICC